jgi:hypothetical protein
MVEQADWREVLWSVIERVREYTGGSVGWIAKQHMPDNDETFGFVIGNGFAAVTLTAARTADDELIRELARQVLGYPVGSAKFYFVKHAAAQDELGSIEAELTRLTARKTYLERLSDELLDKFREAPCTWAEAGL